MIDRNNNFTTNQVPVDVLWLDINYADVDCETIECDNYQFFIFNPKNFTTLGLEQMNGNISESGRGIVAIADPSIKATDDYRVFKDGITIQSTTSPPQNVDNIFVQDVANNGTYFAECDTGNSSWIDFLNTNAQQFWQDQISYQNFSGSNSNYNLWNDLNEPTLYDNETSTTLPMDALHYMASGMDYMHRDLHNVYGAL